MAVDTTFYRRWPQSAPQSQPEAMAQWRAKHLVMKPDVGNLRKAFLDALEGIVYLNDSQVVGGQEWKDFAIKAPEGFTVMWLRELET